jgi:hypothetical protein
MCAKRRTFCTLCQEYHACTGAPNGAPLLGKPLQLWYQPPLLGNKRHGGAFSTWDDETRYGLQLLFGADFNDLHARDLLQHGHVLPE